MLAYHDHSNEQALRRVATCIEEGGAVALISDAGTPLISDPGYRLLQQAHSAGWKVVPVPGASAVIAALSVAGLPTDRFRFDSYTGYEQMQFTALASRRANSLGKSIRSIDESAHLSVPSKDGPVVIALIALSNLFLQEVIP